MEDEFQIEQDEDGRWVAESRLLPGCATWGYTRQEAIDLLREALAAWLDHRRREWFWTSPSTPG